MLSLFASKCIHLGIINSTSNTTKTIKIKSGFCFMEANIIQSNNTLQAKDPEPCFIIIINPVISASGSTCSRHQ